MRRITMWLLGTVCGLVLLFSYRTSTMGTANAGAAQANPVPAGPPQAAAPAPPQAAAPQPPAVGGSATPAPTTGTGNRTVNGSVASTRWGPVQVQIRISGSKITDVAALQLPNGNRMDQQINGFAVPILRQEALAAQSAQIDTVSGATVTSVGYQQSLQAGLDKANLR